MRSMDLLLQPHLDRNLPSFWFSAYVTRRMQTSTSCYPNKSTRSTTTIMSLTIKIRRIGRIGPPRPGPCPCEKNDHLVSEYLFDIRNRCRTVRSTRQQILDGALTRLHCSSVPSLPDLELDRPTIPIETESRKADLSRQAVSLDPPLSHRYEPPLYSSTFSPKIQS